MSDPSPSPSTGCVEPALTSLLVEAIKEIASAEAASILVPDHRGNLVFALVAGGAGLHLSHLSIPVDSGVAGRVFHTGLPEIAHFPAASDASKQVQDETGFVTKSLLAVPLVDANGKTFAIAEAVNPVDEQKSFQEEDLRALMEVREPLADAFRALQTMGSDTTAMPRFYRAVVEVMDRRTTILRQRNDDLHTSRRAFEMTRARHYSDEKMMALARMASGISHEINNPLSVAVSNLGSLAEACVDLLDAHRSDDERELIEDVQEMTADIQVELGRIHKIVSQLMFFGDREVTRLDRVDLVQEAQRILGVVDDHQAPHVEITIECDAVPPVFASRNHVRQVLLELVENAVHAASRTTSEKGEVLVRIFASGGTVHASVGDNGPGIEPRNIERVFEPFFTCKSDWHATGLGLTAAYGVIRALGGQLAIDSVTGKGTIVVASFPIEAQENAELPPHLVGEEQDEEAADETPSERADTWRGRVMGASTSKSTSGRYYDDLQ